MTLKDLLEQQFKVKTRTVINPVLSDGTLTGNVDKILSNNPNRLAVLIINLGSNSCYIGFDRDVSSTKGILVSQLGGSASLLWNEDFELTGYEMYAKGTLADTLYVVEIVTA